MSSAAYVTFDEGDGVTSADFRTFCDEHDVTYEPRVVGRNVFRGEGFEIKFGEINLKRLPELSGGELDFSAATPPEHAERVVFSTFFSGSKVPRVARLAFEFWQRFGGRLEADEEVRWEIFLAEDA